MPTKPKRTVITAPPKPPPEVTSDFALPMEMPSTSIVIAEPPSIPKRKAATKASAPLKPLKRQRSTPSVTESDKSLASVQTCLAQLQVPTHPNETKRDNLLSKHRSQIKNKSIISAIKTAAAKSQQNKSDFTVGPFSPEQSYPTQYYISPKYEGPDVSMTVGEAERFFGCDSD